MALNLTKFPKGLTSLFGLRDLGKVPGSLSEELRGSIDVTQFYLLNDRELVTLSGVAALAAGSNNYAEVVPPGELWYVWSFVVAVDPGAGAAATYRPQIAADGFAFGFPLSDGPYQVATANTFSRVSIDGFWAPAGTIFSVHCFSQTLAPAALGRAVVTKMRV